MENCYVKYVLLQQPVCQVRDGEASGLVVFQKNKEEKLFFPVFTGHDLIEYKRLTTLEKKKGYLEYYRDPNIPLLERILSGIGAILLSPFYLLSGCTPAKDAASLKDTGSGDVEILYDDDSEEGPGSYSTYGIPWSSTSLTYVFDNSAGSLSESGSENAIKEAFEVWEGACTNLRFTKTESSADIVIGWYEGEHGDGYPFDGGGRDSSNTLAHAFYPGSDSIGGDTHFDDYEIWSYASTVPDGEIDLVTVAIHEFGHALGLDHSLNPNAIMYPTYTGLRRYLGTDDRDGIQFLYECEEVCDKDEDGYEMEDCGGNDCDDSNSSIHPDATEDCADGIDNNCNDAVDTSDAECVTECNDTDGDGYGVGDDCPREDCDDSDPEIYPNARELAGNDVDEDCDGEAPNIQEAIEDEEGCGTVYVGPGTYYENIEFPSDSCVTLKSTDGAESTIIDGSSEGPVVTFDNVSNSTPAVIEGFTIQHAGEPGMDSAGIFSIDSNIEILNNIIRQNEFTTYTYNLNSGLFLYGGQVYVDGNEIYENVSAYGAGIYLFGEEEGTISNNYIHDNESYACTCCYVTWYKETDVSFSGNACDDNLQGVLECVSSADETDVGDEWQNCW